MSNEDKGRLIDLVKSHLLAFIESDDTTEKAAEALAGDILSKYNLTPIGDTKEG